MHGLKEYSWLIDRIRKYNAELGIEKVTIRAIRDIHMMKVAII